MHKITFIVCMLIAISVCSQSFADSNTLNLCGTYFEDNNRGYILVAQEDLRTGSKECNNEEYKARLSNTGHQAIALDSTKNRSMLSNWRKFNNHLIEVRGKVRNGQITGTRLVRDRGV